jgi:hypothetical protein
VIFRLLTGPILLFYVVFISFHTWNFSHPDLKFFVGFVVAPLGLSAAGVHAPFRVHGIL